MSVTSLIIIVVKILWELPELIESWNKLIDEYRKDHSTELAIVKATEKIVADLPHEESQKIVTTALDEFMKTPEYAALVGP